MAATNGNLTIVEVSADNTAFNPVCTYTNEASVDFGTVSVNKEFCLSDDVAIVSTGQRDFGSQTYNHLWLEGAGSAGNAIIKSAHEASILADKEIYIRVTANNSGGVSGTTYTAKFIITSYKHMFKKGEVNKTEWACEQLDMPVEVAAS